MLKKSTIIIRGTVGVQSEEVRMQWNLRSHFFHASTSVLFSLRRSRAEVQLPAWGDVPSGADHRIAEPLHKKKKKSLSWNSKKFWITECVP